MTLIFNCVICEKEIVNPAFFQCVCDNPKCKFKYQRYLMWRFREKQKINKVVKIKKIKGKTK